MMNKILCVGFTPALQRIMRFEGLKQGGVNRCTDLEFAAAGKAVNTAKVLQELGSAPVVTGFLAGASGKQLETFLTTLGLEAYWEWHAGETRNAHTLIDALGQEVTELVEEAANPPSAHWEKLFGMIDRLLGEVQAIALCGALAPTMDPDVYRKVLALANRHALPCVLDAKGESLHFALEEKPYLVKMNEEELAVTAKRSLSSETDLLAAMRVLSSGGSRVLVTQGKAKAYLDDGRNRWSLCPPTVEVKNPIGSGDSVTAGILHKLCGDEKLIDCVAFGIACGSANAETSRPGEFSAGRVAELLPQVGLEQLD